MPQAEIISITTRRNALRIGTAATIAGLGNPLIAQPAALGPDTELLKLCGAFDADSLALRRHDDASHALSDIELYPLLDRWCVTIDRITAIPARSLIGIRAKATALGHALMQQVAVNIATIFEDQASGYELLAMSLARDLAAMPGR